MTRITKAYHPRHLVGSSDGILRGRIGIVGMHAYRYPSKTGTGQMD